MENNEQIIEKIEKLMNGEIPNGKFQLLRMYGTYEREQKNASIVEKFRERVSSYIMEDIILVSEKEAICKVKRRDMDKIYYQPVILSNYQNILFETIDEAMIMLVCMRNDCVDAAQYMMRLMKHDE